MKKRRDFVVVLLCSILVVLTIVKMNIVKAGTNTNYETAVQISIGVEKIGMISTEGEEDYYYIKTGDQNAYYQIIGSSLTEEMGFSIALCDSEFFDMDQISFDTQESEVMTYKLEKNSVYYLKVSMWSTETSGSYKIKVNQIVDDYVDTAEKCTEISMGDMITGKFEVGKDQDYFKFTTEEENSFYKIVFKNIDIETDIDLELCTEEGAVIDSVSVAQGEIKYLENKLEKNTTYYIRAYSWWDTAVGSYSIKPIEIVDDVDDTFDTTTKLTVDRKSTNKYALQIGTDEDYFMFKTNGNTEQYKITLKHLSENSTDIQAYLFDENEGYVENLSVGENQEVSITVTLVKNKTYYLKIAEGESGTQYQISVDGVYTPIKKLILSKSKVVLKKGGKITLLASYKPENASITSFSWKTSKKKIASVTQKGVVKGMKAGKASVQCIYQSKDGTKKTAVCKVIVKK